MVEQKTGIANVVVTRTSARDIGIRSLELFLDDTFVADLTFGKLVTMEVAAGPHQFKVSNRLYKKTLEITVRAGDQVELSVGNIMQGVTAALTSMLGTGAYKVFIEEVSRKGSR